MSKQDRQDTQTNDTAHTGAWPDLPTIEEIMADLRAESEAAAQSEPAQPSGLSGATPGTPEPSEQSQKPAITETPVSVSGRPFARKKKEKRRSDADGMILRDETGWPLREPPPEETTERSGKKLLQSLSGFLRSKLKAPEQAAPPESVTAMKQPAKEEKKEEIPENTEKKTATEPEVSKVPKQVPKAEETPAKEQPQAQPEKTEAPTDKPTEPPKPIKPPEQQNQQEVPAAETPASREQQPEKIQEKTEKIKRPARPDKRLAEPRRTPSDPDNPVRLKKTGKHPPEEQTAEPPRKRPKKTVQRPAEPVTETEKPEEKAEEEPENMSFLERIQYHTRMRRREQTRLRRENARLGHSGEANFQALTKTDIRLTCIRLAAAGALTGLGVLFRKSTAGFCCYLAAYLIVMLPVAIRVVQHFTHKTYFNEYLLILIASVGAFLLNYRAEASIILILHDIGKLANDMVIGSTHKSLMQQVRFVPEKASIVNMQGEERMVAPADIRPGEFILVRSGERIPIDGYVLRGTGTVDDTLLTGAGEPMPVVKGAHVLAGGLYDGTLLLLRAAVTFQDCAVSRILRTQEASVTHRARLETGIVEGSERFIPVLIVLAVLLAVLPPLFHSSTSIPNWIYRALTVLVVCCPAALTVAVPLSFTSGAGHLAQKGIHAKGSETIEKMAELRMAVFDKTSILTVGALQVKEVQPTQEFNQESCLALAAAAEQLSQHPVAQAIRAASQSAPRNVTEFEEYPGRGVRARIGNRNLLAGNRRLMVSRGVKGVPDLRGTVVYVSYEGDYAGAVILEDQIRPEASDAIEKLKSQGVLRTVILTGDTEAPAQQVADTIGIDTVHHSLVPEEKASKMEFLLRTIPTDGTSGYIGDGTNDADILKQADVGIIMGLGGSQEAADAANMLIMSNDLLRLADAMRICRKTHRVAMQNLTLVLLMKVLLTILALMGVVAMWQAVAADVLVTVITVLNAARILGAK